MRGIYKWFAHKPWRVVLYCMIAIVLIHKFGMMDYLKKLIAPIINAGAEFGIRMAALDGKK